MQRLLELLQQILMPYAEGKEVYAELRQILMDMEFSHSHTEQAYAAFLDLLLQACISQIPQDSVLHRQLNYIQKRIKPPISVTEISNIYQLVQRAAEQLRRAGVLSLEQVSLILGPLLLEYSSVAQRPDEQMQRKILTKREKPDRSGQDTSPPGEKDSAGVKCRRNLREAQNIGFDVLDAMSFGNEANNYRSNVQHLQQNFVHQLRDAVQQVSAFGEQLESEIRDIGEFGPIDDVEDYRISVINTLESLRSGHEKLAKNFESARTYLSVIESGSQKLMDELDRVRVLSLTDELTSLPNRRAFLRRIDTEVSRVKRYRNPLSLVIIDLDHFKNINDQHGHSAGDAVLKAYADNIFTLFRHHDLVARYGGEEFVMLFPNTDLSGVLLALQKIQAKCKRIKVKIGAGKTIQLPGFSAGVAEYQQGEATESFIERADSALYQAKEKGRGRIEVSRNGDTDVVLEDLAEDGLADE